MKVKRIYIYAYESAFLFLMLFVCLSLLIYFFPMIIITGYLQEGV